MERCSLAVGSTLIGEGFGTGNCERHMVNEDRLSDFKENSTKHKYLGNGVRGSRDRSLVERSLED